MGIGDEFLGLMKQRKELEQQAKPAPGPLVDEGPWFSNLPRPKAWVTTENAGPGVLGIQFGTKEVVAESYQRDQARRLLERAAPPEPEEEKGILETFKEVPSAFSTGDTETRWQVKLATLPVGSADAYRYAAGIKANREKQGYDETVLPDDVLNDLMNVDAKAFGKDIAVVSKQVAGMLPAMIKGGVGALGGGVAGSVFPGVGTVAGAAAGAASYWTVLSAGMLRGEMINEGIDDRIAAPVALLLAAPYALIEVEQAKIALPVFGQIARKFVTPMVKGAVANLAVKYGKDWMKEVSQEALQRVLEEIARDIGAYIQGVAGGRKVERPGLLYSLIKAPAEELEAVALPMAGLLGPKFGVQAVRTAQAVSTVRKAEAGREIMGIARGAVEDKVNEMIEKYGSLGVDVGQAPVEVVSDAEAVVPGEPPAAPVGRIGGPSEAKSFTDPSGADWQIFPSVRYDQTSGTYKLSIHASGGTDQLILRSDGKTVLINGKKASPAQVHPTLKAEMVKMFGEEQWVTEARSIDAEVIKWVKSPPGPLSDAHLIPIIANAFNLKTEGATAVLSLWNVFRKTRGDAVFNDFVEAGLSTKSIYTAFVQTYDIGARQVLALGTTLLHQEPEALIHELGHVVPALALTDLELDEVLGIIHPLLVEAGYTEETYRGGPKEGRKRQLNAPSPLPRLGVRGWTRGDAEFFADSLTKYIHEGKAPTEFLARVFETIKRFMSNVIKIYYGDPKLTPELRQFFDKMLAPGESVKALDDMKPVETPPVQQPPVEVPPVEAPDQYYVDYKGTRQAFPSVQAAEAWIRQNVEGASDIPIRPLPEKSKERTNLSKTIHMWAGAVFKDKEGKRDDVQYREFLRKAVGIDSTKYMTEAEMEVVKGMLKELRWPAHKSQTVTPPVIEPLVIDDKVQAISDFVKGVIGDRGVTNLAVVNWLGDMWDKIAPPLRPYLVRFAADEFRSAGKQAKMRMSTSFRYAVEDLTKIAGNTRLLRSWYELSDQSGRVKNWLHKEFRRMQKEAGVHFTYLNTNPEQRELFARALFEENKEEQARLVNLMNDPARRLFNVMRSFAATGGPGADSIRAARWQEWNYWALQVDEFKLAHPEVFGQDVANIPAKLLNDYQELLAKLKEVVPANVKPEAQAAILAAGRAAWAQGWRPFKEWIKAQSWGTRAEYFLSDIAEGDLVGSNIEGYIHTPRTPFKEGTEETKIREPRVRGLVTREEGARPMLKGDILRQLYLHFYRAELNARVLPFLRDYKDEIRQLDFKGEKGVEGEASAARNVLERNLMNTYARPESQMWPGTRLPEFMARWFWTVYFMSKGPWFFIRNLGQNVAFAFGHLNASTFTRAVAKLTMQGKSDALAKAMAPGGDFETLVSQREAMEREWIMVRPGMEFDERFIDRFVGWWAGASDDMNRKMVYPIAFTAYEDAVKRFRDRGMTNGARGKMIRSLRLDTMTGGEQLLLWEKIVSGDDEGGAGMYAKFKAQAVHGVYKTTGRSGYEQWRVGRAAIGLITFPRLYVEQYTRNAARNLIGGARTHDWGRAWRGTTMIARLYVGMVISNMLLRGLAGRRRGPEPYDPIDVAQWTPPSPGAAMIIDTVKRGWQAIAYAREGKWDTAIRIAGRQAELMAPVLDQILRVYESFGDRAGVTATNLLVAKVFHGEDKSVYVRRSASQAFLHLIFGTWEYPEMGEEKSRSQREFEALLGAAADAVGHLMPIGAAKKEQPVEEQPTEPSGALMELVEAIK